MLFLYSPYRITEYLLVSILLSVSLNCRADFLFSADATSVQGSLTSTTTSTQTQTYLDIGLMLGLSSKSQIYFGTIYLNSEINERNLSGVTTIMSIQDLLIGTKYFFGKDRAFNMTAAYGVLSSAHYKNGSSATETWTGSSTLFKIAYTPMITQRASIGVAISYYQASYIKKEVSSVATSYSGSKSFLIPMLSLNFYF
ncbi:MAG: hypothetical protein AABY64_03680 [Bdellovibrionota bacterium]